MDTLYFDFTIKSFDITPAVKLLLQGEIIVLPTDTVYGFHSIVKNNLKEQINTIKGCEKTKPLITLDINFTPPFECNEPTTFIMDNNAVRNPKDTDLADILKIIGQPIYSTSANLTGEEVLNNGKDIYNKFKGQVAAVFDIGKLDKKSSKIVKLVKGEWITVRN
ncbi:MAG: Sua5/YciO/YrdC/YwlC family protein [Oscillospiraceae bacterium]|jgi:L-threonylcarbamoyladenylate synthase|nr:Sua5/YciO/YrdC/YwlC family protein [Oscillospiraceae bacterium]